MRLYSEAAGEGPGVVLVHAGICDSRMWEPQWRSFPPSHRTVRYDLRGFGRSPIPPGSYSHAGDLAEVLEVNGLKSASLVGVSLGGRVALELAIAVPNSSRASSSSAPVSPDTPGRPSSRPTGPRRKRRFDMATSMVPSRRT